MHCTKCDRCGLVGIRQDSGPYPSGTVSDKGWSEISSHALRRKVAVTVDGVIPESTPYLFGNYELPATSIHLCAVCTDEVWQFLQCPKPIGTGTTAEVSVETQACLDPKQEG